MFATALVIWLTASSAFAQDGIVVVEDSRPTPIIIVEDSRPFQLPIRGLPDLSSLYWWRDWFVAQITSP